MPDQWALHWLLRQVVEPATKPLFTTFVSVTSHAPFTSVPPYVADWRLDAASFAGPPARQFAIPWLELQSHPDLVPAFLGTLEHALRSVVGFVCRLPRPSLVIVLGDHQPPFAGALVPPDPSFDVPIHVFANRPDLLAPFAAFGFVPGTALPAELPSFDSAEFAPLLLRAFAK
jgi:hypothetical protein